MGLARTVRVRVGEVTLHAEDTGDGPAVLLLHGFPDSLHLWREVTPLLLAGGYRVIAVDQRGFGESDAPVGRRRYAFGRLVGDMIALLVALGVEGPVRVMGHDWGTVVAWGLAMWHPERVSAAVAISVGHPREYALAGWEQKARGLYTLGWQFPVLAERWLMADGWARMRHWLRQHPDPEACLRDLARPGRLTSGLNWYRANLASVLFRTWPSCAVPVLGIWGSADHCLAEDQMRRSSRRMAAPWRYERIDGGGHWLPLGQPERIAALALEWFRGNPYSP